MRAVRLARRAAGAGNSRVLRTGAQGGPAGPPQTLNPDSSKAQGADEGVAEADVRHSRGSEQSNADPILFS